MARGQRAGEECAQSEKRSSCEQTACGERALHPVGEDGAEKAIKGKTDDDARGRTDERDARSDPQDMRARRAQRQADAELRSTLRDAVSDHAEDADQRKRQGDSREDAKQYGEEPPAAVLCVALDGFVEREGAVEGAAGDLLVGSDGCDRSAHGVQIGERIALCADEELHVGRYHDGVGKVDGG